jgi:hypothetical protein
MIILQATVEGTLTWRNYLQDANQAAQIIGTIMVIIYVIYTYQTFKQIKKQTDYQQDAYLKVDHLILKDFPKPQAVFMSAEGKFIPPSNYSTKYLNTNLPSKMTDVLKPIFKLEDNLFDGNYYTLNMINYGNAEVNKINIKLNVTILNSKELMEKKMLKDKEVHNLDIEIPEIVGRNGGKLRIPLISTASFPIYTIVVRGEYYDVRNKRYIIPETTLTGENKHFHALPS